MNGTGFKVIVIGGGMAGLLLGNGLERHGIDFTLFEADPETSERDGYQIRLGAPAISGFNACLDDESRMSLYPKFGYSGGVVSSAPILYDARLRVLLDLTKFPAYTKSAPITRAALRDHLAAPLRQAGYIEYSRKFTNFKCIRDDAGKTKVKVFFQDGSEDVCDLLVSAEGAWSKINRQIGLNNITHLTTHWNLSAKCSIDTEKLAKLPPEIERGPIAVSHDGLFLFFSAYVAAGANKNTISTSNRKLEYCVDMLKGWDTRFHDLLRSIGPENVQVFQHHTSQQPAANWRSTAKASQNTLEAGNEHVWLLGDAIHAMTPGRGMGGNQAMCDTADILPQIVQLAEKSKTQQLKDKDYQVAVAAFEKAMFPRAFDWVRKSGGTDDKSGVDASTLFGRVTLFIMARVLDAAYVYGMACKILGYGPQDDAPELI
ncbi:hypothetical protein Sste5346_010316 [Sporothrix stenoceras]|uniref:FAD-binding domain-containing protein n=1 Tax=Sporothrix stenoceras TaxID=5173 RepID=A0ABR3YGY5_9PEZI